MKVYVRFLTFFYVFSKSKNHDFLRFFEVLHTFSRTLRRPKGMSYAFCLSCRHVFPRILHLKLNSV